MFSTAHAVCSPKNESISDVRFFTDRQTRLTVKLAFQGVVVEAN